MDECGRNEYASTKMPAQKQEVMGYLLNVNCKTPKKGTGFNILEALENVVRILGSHKLVY